MDSVVTAIVDVLRRKKDREALNKGGYTIGAGPDPRVVPQRGLPRAIEPKHGGRPYSEIIDEASR